MLRLRTPWIHNRSKTSLCKFRTFLTSSAFRDGLQEFDDTLDTKDALTPSAKWFIDDNIFQLEKKTVFGKSWVAVGSSLNLKNVGDSISGVLGNTPYLVVKDEDGVKGFANICRHRGHKLDVVCDEGGEFNLKCCYHGWLYNKNGRLIKPTKYRGVRSFSGKKYSLLPINTHSWNNFVFMNLDSEATTDTLYNNYNTLFQGLEERWKFGSKDWIFCHKKTYNVKGNWKLIVENNLDAFYHVPYLHSTSLGKELDFDSKDFSYTKFYSTTQFKGSGDTFRNIEKSEYATLFPNISLNLYGPWMEIDYILPVSATETNIDFEFYLDPEFVKRKSEDELKEFIRSSVKESDRVQAEDTSSAESCQLSLNSEYYREGRYCEEFEAAQYQFHCYLKSFYDGKES